MRYLIQTVETYRADTEAEAQGLIAEAKQAGEYALTKYVSEKKEVKAKGEVIDEYYNYVNEFPEGKYIKEAEKILKTAQKYVND